MPVPTTLPTLAKRLNILGDEEIEALYGRPCFTDEERLEYFALSPPEKAALERFHSIPSRLYFLLQLGYFKSHHLFFVFTWSEVGEEVTYLQEQYFPGVPETEGDHEGDAVEATTGDFGPVPLSHLWCPPATSPDRRARQAATICAKPVYLFRELLHYLKEHRWVAPATA